MTAGGFELLEAFVESDMSMKDTTLLLVGVAGIALRINTHTSVEL